MGVEKEGITMGVEADLVGQTLGAYRIIEQIGRGGMATVYKAYEPALDRYVALKVLPQYFAHDPNFAARFEREAKAVARLDHPNILPIYSFGQEAGLSYIAMRYVEAGTLKEMLGQPLDLKTTADILGQIGRALDYAHQRGVVHRDVKPTNVLMAEGKWALLTDFGLARMVESSVQLTKSGVGIGTPAYMSPEQGQGLKVDARSDVYSLGVVLYEMVTGRVPHEAETPMAVVLKHITAPLPLPREVTPDLPEAVERVILKAMAKNPWDRYQTAGEMVEALEVSVQTFSPLSPKRNGKGITETSEMAQIFLCYAREDEEKVENLYQKLSDAGFKPWMAKKDIIGGEIWERSIQTAIRLSDFFVVCLSATSVNKRSFIQKEIRNALGIWQEKLDSDIYLIPIRLEECEVPESLCDFQWVDLFAKDGWERLVKALRVGTERRSEEIKPIVQKPTPLEPYPDHEESLPGTEMATLEESPEQVRPGEGSGGSAG